MTRDDKEAGGPLEHGVAGSPGHRMVIVKGPRWSQGKGHLYKEGPHSRAIMVWGY